MNTIQGKNEGISIKKDIKDISIFRDNRFCLFVYKKTSRLSAGIYLVTNLLSDSEPLKWELRKHAQRLVSLSVDETIFSASFERTIITALHGSSLAILSLLEIALYGNLISQMNHVVLKEEFMSFIISLEEKLEGVQEISGPLDPHFFELQKEYKLSRNDMRHGREAGNTKLSPFAHKGHYIGQLKKANVLDNYSDKSNKGQPDPAHLKQEQKNSRKETILRLLKDKQSLTVKDVSSSIKDCSEKTIQRELLSLVASGVLKKEGERRWSRYSLLVS
ncbi:hypothetical protein EPO17_02965 [Patescibacteria group bacterium]|nr:MAG: hypothetical protein EPO17_02965 [Patescibacteria group bacterium]